MAVAITELLPTDDASSDWVPVAEAAARAGVTPAAVRRAARAGRLPFRQEAVGRRSRTVVALADVVAVLGPAPVRVDEALRRADDAMVRAERAEELTRFLRDELAALHLATEELQREVKRLGQEQFRVRVTTVCDDDGRAPGSSRRRAWPRRARLS